MSAEALGKVALRAARSGDKERRGVVDMFEILVLAGLVGAVVLLVVNSRRRDDPAREALARRVSDMAARMDSNQAVLADRLSQIDRRVGDSLQASTKQTLETMTKVQERLAIIDRAQSEIASLGNRIVSLQDILSDKQSRGAFGELQLNDLVSTILPPSAYRFQATLSNGARPDCLLDLPKPPGAIAVDAKFPLDGYRALREANGPDETAKARRRFRDDLAKHIRDIAAKYIVPGETAESAIMFLPSEAVYAELHANFGAVVEESYRRRVFVVSPTTLMATLNTIRAVLKDARMREQAGVIQRELARMLDDVRRLGERVHKLDRHFDQAGEDVRQIRISTDKIAGKAERIAELDMKDAADRATVAGSRSSGED